MGLPALEIQCLGTLILARLGDTFIMYFLLLFNSIKMQLTQWNSTQFYWFGRCSIIKMSDLPKFLYLLSALLICIPPSSLQLTHRELSRFLWDDKKPKPRIRCTLLTLPKVIGDLALLDIANYHMARHLVRLLDWNCAESPKKWVSLKQNCSPHPLQDPNLLKHPIIGPTL